MKTSRFLLISILLSAPGACSSSTGDAGDGGRLDGPAVDAMVALNIPASGLYKVTAYTAQSDECKFMLDSATNSTNPMDWITVTVDGSSLKVGNPRGVPAMAGLGEGTITGTTVMLTRNNHIGVAGGSTCNYDEVVTSTATLDDPTKRTFGLGVSDRLTNRTMCDIPTGVGPMCTTVWSWRLTFMQ
jgi:hypothetical protein